MFSIKSYWEWKFCVVLHHIVFVVLPATGTLSSFNSKCVALVFWRGKVRVCCPPLGFGEFRRTPFDEGRNSLTPRLGVLSFCLIFKENTFTLRTQNSFHLYQLHCVLTCRVLSWHFGGLHSWKLNKKLLSFMRPPFSHKKGEKYIYIYIFKNFWSFREWGPGCMQVFLSCLEVIHRERNIYTHGRKRSILFLVRWDNLQTQRKSIYGHYC